SGRFSGHCGNSRGSDTEEARRAAGSQTPLEFAAAIGVVEPLRVFFGRLWPCRAAAAQRSGEVGRTFGIEGLAALLTIGRYLDQQVVYQRLHVPRLVRRQIAETHD